MPVQSAQLRELTELVERVLARVDALEAKLGGIERRPVVEGPAGDSAPSQAELRRLVEDVLAAAETSRRERAEQERYAEELDREATFRNELRFQVGMVLLELEKELSLSPAQKGEITDAVIELELARSELQEGLDPASVDPEAWRAEFEATETRFWARLESSLGPALAEQLRGHF
jgi:hypothetical protein